MTRILISGFEPELEQDLEEKLVELENEVEMAPFDEYMDDKFLEFIPDIVLMNFSDMNLATKMTKKLIELDSTACIFAVADKMDNVSNDNLYNSGVRVVLDRPSDLDKFLDSLYGACNDLDHENCIGCWKFNRYDNLQKLA